MTHDLFTEDGIIDQILEDEAGIVDRADDHGGPTNRGVTLKTFSAWKGLPKDQLAPKAELWALTEAEAREIYRSEYIVKPRFYEIPHPKVRALVIDCGVLHGQATAAQFLQRACKVKADGRVGALTLFAASRRDPLALYCDVMAERIEYIGMIITDNMADHDHDGKPDNAENAKGWLRLRAAEWLRRAV